MNATINLLKIFKQPILIGLTSVILAACGGGGGSGSTPAPTPNPTPADTTAPVISLSGAQALTIEQGTAYSDAGATATDDVDGAVTVSTTGSVISSSAGEYTLTYSATDAAGNTHDESFTITVSDDEDPSIDGLSANLTPSAAAGTCGADVSWDEPTANDNCAGASIAQTAGLPSGSAFPVGTTTNTFVITDAAGNTATCSFDVTVNDTENPTISCPSDININNDTGNCSAIATFTTPSGADNCSVASVTQIAGLISGSAFPVGTTVVTFRVEDTAGLMRQQEEYIESLVKKNFGDDFDDEEWEVNSKVLNSDKF